MSADVTTALIGALSAVAVVVASYLFTKQREREADWRKEKLEHYKAFVASLSGILSGESTPDGQVAFSRACNNLNLVAPQAVIEALREFQDEIKVSNPAPNRERHNKLMSTLFFAIRSDLGISPTDDHQNFKVGLWASGNKPTTFQPSATGAGGTVNHPLRPLAGGEGASKASG